MMSLGRERKSKVQRNDNVKPISSKYLSVVVILIAFLATNCSIARKDSHTNGSKFQAEIVGPDSDPIYPEFALKNYISGRADILFEIDKNGDASAFTVVREEPKGFKFTSAAIAQILSPKYRVVSPGMSDSRTMKRRFNFDNNYTPVDAPTILDTLTYNYRDQNGNRYIVKTKMDLAKYLLCMTVWVNSRRLAVTKAKIQSPLHTYEMLGFTQSTILTMGLASG
jgi:hypothetical protein